jgi:hypothetical protein
VSVNVRSVGVGRVGVCILMIHHIIFYYESMNTYIYNLVYLKTKTEKSTRLGYTGFHGELEHPKIKSRLIDEKFVSVMGEYVFLK